MEAVVWGSIEFTYTIASSHDPSMQKTESFTLYCVTCEYLQDPFWLDASYSYYVSPSTTTTTQYAIPMLKNGSHPNCPYTTEIIVLDQDGSEEHTLINAVWYELFMVNYWD